MELQLAFASGNIRGDGQDDVGRFLIRGQYDAQELECYWTKTYVGGHDVYYRGFREGKGIWGTWEIGLRGRGGFHIWPRALGEGEGKSDVAEEPIPAEADEVSAASRDSAPFRAFHASTAGWDNPINLPSVAADSPYGGCYRRWIHGKPLVASEAAPRP